jgi:hypothetical protein
MVGESHQPDFNIIFRGDKHHGHLRQGAVTPAKLSQVVAEKDFMLVAGIVSRLEAC